MHQLSNPSPLVLAGQSVSVSDWALSNGHLLHETLVSDTA